MQKMLLSKFLIPYAQRIQRRDVEVELSMGRRSVFTRDKISQLRRRFEGARVELISLYDPLRCPDLNPGELGTVSYVSDTAIIYVDWDSGFSSGIMYDEDEIRTL